MEVDHSRYSQAERTGFVKACSDVPKYDLVAFSDGRDLFFYRNGDSPVLRGSCVPLGTNSYLIYTIGYVTYQRGYHRPRVPRPLEITEHYGDTPLDEIAREVLGLTRLDWNTTDYCIYYPVTLKFSVKSEKSWVEYPKARRSRRTITTTCEIIK